MSKRILSLLLACLFVPGILYARENREIRWKPVRGARGYVVEYRRLPDGDVQEMRVKGTRARLRLPAGHYLLRVAALNKFLKPSIWTEWTPVRLDSIAAVVDLARVQGGDEEINNRVEKPESGDKEEVSEIAPDEQSQAGMNVEAEDVEAGARSAWSKLLPGVPQVARGQPARGASYWLAFAGLAGAGGSEWAAAERVSADLRNDPALLALVILPNPLELGLYLRQERLRNEQVFMHHQQNQASIGAAALLLYCLHLVDAFFLAPPGGVNEIRKEQAEPNARLYFDISPEAPERFAGNVRAGGLTGEFRSDLYLRMRF